MKTDVEMKAILSASPARCCNGNYNHYNLLLEFRYEHYRDYKLIGWKLSEKEGGNISLFFAQYSCLYFSIFLKLQFIVSISNERSFVFMSVSYRARECQKLANSVRECIQSHLFARAGFREFVQRHLLVLCLFSLWLVSIVLSCSRT